MVPLMKRTTSLLAEMLRLLLFSGAWHFDFRLWLCLAASVFALLNPHPNYYAVLPYGADQASVSIVTFFRCVIFMTLAVLLMLDGLTFLMRAPIGAKEHLTQMAIRVSPTLSFRPELMQLLQASGFFRSRPFWYFLAVLLLKGAGLIWLGFITFRQEYILLGLWPWPPWAGLGYGKY